VLVSSLAIRNEPGIKSNGNAKPGIYNAFENNASGRFFSRRISIFLSVAPTAYFVSSPAASHL
jgi:hypothetical protein